MATSCLYVLLALAFLAGAVVPNNARRSFVIDYENDRFLRDGEPIQIVAGAMHYFRTLPQLWDNRLTTMKAAGLNAIQTYVEWSTHEPEEGQFAGAQELVHFLNLAQSHDLLVLLRIGPYICAERDLGGLPYWLLSRNASIRLRTADPEYTIPVEKYFSWLLPLIRPLLYANGGPVIAVQIENEYGSYKACDFSYMAWLRDLVRHQLGRDVILYTTDGAGDGFLKCGKVDGAYTTVDFGPDSDPEEMFAVQRRHQERGPLMNSEFYTGWLDHWAEKHSRVGTKDVVTALDKILSMNASVTMYMFHGGTSFGYKAGANVDMVNGFQPTPTSYDYDAPMTEAGDPTDKFHAIRDVIAKYLPVPHVPVPEPAKKMALGTLPLTKLYDLKDIRDLFVHYRIPSELPLSFERIRQSQALVLYETWVDFLPRDPAVLTARGLRDRGYVYVDDVYQGIISRMDNVYSIMIPVTKGQRLTILVESQGRVGFIELNDPKGLGRNVTLSGITLTDWNMTAINEKDHLTAHRRLDDGVKFWTSNESAPSCVVSPPGVAVYQATFRLDVSPPLDTYLRLDHWKKGTVILNGFNLGRYWTPMGPQRALYVPAVLFREENLLDIIELEQAPCGLESADCYVEFVEEPDINGTVPLSRL
uniref:Beta-galactosidase n=1 Tax=Rhipicephalus appendiculatus TaxID=34631 RepID=A0A131YM23_RHIAP